MKIIGKVIDTFLIIFFKYLMYKLLKSFLKCSQRTQKMAKAKLIDGLRKASPSCCPHFVVCAGILG